MANKLKQEMILGFVEEAKSYLSNILGHLEAWGRNPAKNEAMEEARASAHTIKGASAMAGLSEVSHLAYELEELMACLGDGRVRFEEHVVEAVGLSIDLLDQRLDALKQSGEWQDGSLAEPLGLLREVLGKGEASSEPAPVHQLEAWQELKPNQPIAEPTPDEGHEISPELMEAFRYEAEELLQGIGQAFLDLQGGARQRDCIQQIRRNVHTLKGAAGLVGFERVSHLAHRMEDLLDQLYEDGLELTPEALDALHVSFDAIDDVLKGHATAAAFAARASELELRLQALASARQPEESSEPAAAEAGADEPEMDFQDSAWEQSGAAPAPKEGDQFLRVSIDRLDELVRLVSELVISRSTFEQHYQHLIHEVEEMQPSMKRLRRVVSKLETDYRAMLMPSREESAPLPAKAQAGGEFDELEFDRYSELYLLTRELTETTEDVRVIGHELNDLVGDFESYITRQRRLTTEIQDKLTRLRMVPLSNLSSRLHRVVRVTAKQLNKQANLRIEGEAVGMDRAVLEELSGPLLHLLRNAVHHGIEPESKRKALNKPAAGQIRIHAFQEGTEVVVQVEDDGGGLNVDKIRAVALDKGLISEAEAETMKESELFSLIFVAGFSTADEISEVSGRGVGMDAVRSTVHRLKGSVKVQSRSLQGTRFTIRLPMSLALLRVLLVRVQRETFALPLSSVFKILRVEKEEIEKIGQEPVLRSEGQTYPLLKLSEVLNIRHVSEDPTSRVLVVIVRIEDKRVALIVDQLIQARDVVVKSMGSHLRKVRGVFGATLMGDGSVVLILNPAELLGEQTTRRIAAPAAKPSRSSVAESASKPLTVMIVDDSFSVRRVLTNLIEKAGWRPVQAKDGLEALEILNQGGELPDVMLLDIEMPRMDGYELTTSLRSQDAFSELPIVMLTSRSGDKHRRKALELGVTDYLVKPFQEEVLLGLVKKYGYGNRGK